MKADRAYKESKREAETEDARTLRLHDQAHLQDLLRQTETEDARISLYLLDTLDEDDDTLGEVPRALRLHKQRLKTLERTVLAERAEALSRLDSAHEQGGP